MSRLALAIPRRFRALGPSVAESRVAGSAGPGQRPAAPVASTINRQRSSELRGGRTVARSQARQGRGGAACLGGGARLELPRWRRHAGEGAVARPARQPVGSRDVARAARHLPGPPGAAADPILEDDRHPARRAPRRSTSASRPSTRSSCPASFPGSKCGPRYSVGDLARAVRDRDEAVARGDFEGAYELQTDDAQLAARIVHPPLRTWLLDDERARLHRRRGPVAVRRRPDGRRPDRVLARLSLRAASTGSRQAYGAGLAPDRPSGCRRVVEETYRGVLAPPAWAGLRLSDLSLWCSLRTSRMSSTAEAMTATRDPRISHCGQEALDRGHPKAPGSLTRAGRQIPILLRRGSRRVGVHQNTRSDDKTHAHAADDDDGPSPGGATSPRPHGQALSEPALGSAHARAGEKAARQLKHAPRAPHNPGWHRSAGQVTRAAQRHTAYILIAGDHLSTTRRGVIVPSGWPVSAAVTRDVDPYR